MKQKKLRSSWRKTIYLNYAVLSVQYTRNHMMHMVSTAVTFEIKELAVM